ncbi:hypothetical protein Q2941_29225 [Bradyrhizobium sp. UFLA05-153]
MSALYSRALEKPGSQRGYVVAGSLYIGDERVFGEDKEFDGKELSDSNLDWGDAWVVYNDWIADVSVCRTADAGTPRTRQRSRQEQRLVGVLLECNDPSGIRYVPQYVLT